MITAKNEVFIGLSHENGEGADGKIKIWWGMCTEWTFPGGGGMSKFLASGGGLPHSSNRENPVNPLHFLKYSLITDAVLKKVLSVLEISGLLTLPE